MSAWEYMFATVSDVPSELRGEESGLRDLRLQDPRVSIHCLGNVMTREDGSPAEELSHQSRPWLFGSFEPAYQVLERTGELRWSMVDTYPTGDGHAIPLGRQTVQYLEQDRPTDEVSAQTSETVRNRYSFKCERCGLSRAWQSENLQLPLNLLARVGVREVSLKSFAKAVSKSQQTAKARGC